MVLKKKIHLESLSLLYFGTKMFFRFFADEKETCKVVPIISVEMFI